VIAAGGLAAAEVGACSSHAGQAANAPSKLDYMVLASFVDSPHLLSIAGYRATAHQGVIMSDGKFTPHQRTAAGVPGAGPPAAGKPAVDVGRP
jgi:hypothetical protein